MKIRLVFDLEPRLQPHLGFAHLSLDLGLRHERGDGVDDDHVDRTGSDQHLRDLERLLAVVWLRDEEVLRVHSELLSVVGVQGVLGVDEGREASRLLRLRDDLQRKRRLARRLRAENLHDAPSRDAAHSQSCVHGERAGGNHGNDGLRLISQPHDGTLAELTFDLRERRLYGAPLFGRFDAGHVLTFLCEGSKFPRVGAIIDSATGGR